MFHNIQRWTTYVLSDVNILHWSSKTATNKWQTLIQNASLYTCEWQVLQYSDYGIILEIFGLMLVFTLSRFIMMALIIYFSVMYSMYKIMKPISIDKILEDYKGIVEIKFKEINKHNKFSAYIFLYRHLFLKNISNILKGDLLKKMDETLPGTIVRSVGMIMVIIGLVLQFSSFNT